MIDFALFASFGNDSIALIQWAKNRGLRNVTVVYNNTGWAADWWPKRVEKAMQWVRSIGYETVEIQSEGMLNLVDRKQAWPRGGGGKYQFCTAALKEEPSLEWLDKFDPEKEVVCMIGVRREESPNRATFPEWTEQSDKHGGRNLFAPLVRHSEADRDELILMTPFKPLPHRSKECYPCVNARKGELAVLPESKITLIAQTEAKAGINSKGNPRVMFSPKRHKGAVGIEAVVRWANNETAVDTDVQGCDGGWCGS